MNTIYVVGAVIVKNNKILCAQRGPSKSLPYKWEFPGGKIETGETPKEALKRENQEELQCEIKVGEQITQTTHQYDFGTVNLTTYYCEVVNGTPISTEHAQVEWFFPHELSELDWAPADTATVENIQNQHSF